MPITYKRDGCGHCKMLQKKGNLAIREILTEIFSDNFMDTRVKIDQFSQ